MYPRELTAGGIPAAVTLSFDHTAYKFVLVILDTHVSQSLSKFYVLFDHHRTYDRVIESVVLKMIKFSCCLP